MHPCPFRPCLPFPITHIQWNTYGILFPTVDRSPSSWGTENPFIEDLPEPTATTLNNV